MGKLAEDRLKNLIEFYLDPEGEDGESAKAFLEAISQDAEGTEKQFRDWLEKMKAKYADKAKKE